MFSGFQVCFHCPCVKHTDNETEYSTPDLFIATVREQNTVLGHLVCQPKPDIPFNKVVEPELDILNAISHYSLVQNNNALLFTKFKGWHL
jgi:hypothetical protein